MDPAETFAQDPLAEFVPVRGVVHLTTSFGVLLDVKVGESSWEHSACRHPIESLSRASL